MQKSCKLLSLLLAALMLLPLFAACAPRSVYDKEGFTFTDSVGNTVTLTKKPQRVAVLFSSFADLWISAGGTVTMTVGESVERGLVPDTVQILAEGAGKTPDAETVIAAAPDLVLFSADLAGHAACAEKVRQAGIPAAELRVESFTDYLNVLKICTDINDRPDLYESVGLSQKARIDQMIAEKPLAGKRILFMRAASKTVKAKDSTDNFAAAMLRELGAENVADSAPLLLDGLSVEAVLAENPDHLIFTAMGSEEGARAAANKLLASEVWRSLDAVKAGKWSFLPKETFHYKPNAGWADAYVYLIDQLK